MNQYNCKELYDRYEENLNEILSRIKSGESLSKISTYFGFNRCGLADWLDKKGYRKKRETKAKYPDGLLRTAYDMCLKGESVTSVAETLGVGRKSLSRRLYEWFSYKPLADGKKQIDDNYFSKIDSHSKAYWLGFFIADGYNNEEKHSLEFLQCENNKDAVYKFKKAIYSCHKVSKKYTSGFLNYKISIRSKRMSEDLANLGIVRNKTFDIILPNIDDLYFWSMLRGYYDGDGSVSFTKWNLPLVCFVSASKKLLEQIKDRLNTDDIKSYIYETNKGRTPHENWSLHINGRYAARFLNKIYVDSLDETRLNIKYKKYLSMLECRPELKTI